MQRGFAIQSGIAILALVLLACAAEPEPGELEVPVRVGTVALDSHSTPVVILEEMGGPRTLPIWIGTAEATSIALEMNAQRSPRPNFHDLAKSVIQTFDGEVLSVVVTELREGIYYALLSLRANGKVVELDVRPSDGIAVALRTDAPIRVRASLFESAGRVERVEPQGEAI